MALLAFSADPRSEFVTAALLDKPLANQHGKLEILHFQ